MNDPRLFACLKLIQVQLLRRRNDLGWDLLGEKRRLRDKLLRNRFRDFSDKAKETFCEGTWEGYRKSERNGLKEESKNICKCQSCILNM